MSDDEYQSLTRETKLAIDKMISIDSKKEKK